MSKSVEIRCVGDKRTVRKQLKYPVTYDLGKGRWLVLKRPASMECTEKWAPNGTWVEDAWLHDTLLVEPTIWERIKALFWAQPQPIPRAVVIIDRQERA